MKHARTAPPFCCVIKSVNSCLPYSMARDNCGRINAHTLKHRQTRERKVILVPAGYFHINHRTMKHCPYNSKNCGLENISNRLPSGILNGVSSMLLIFDQSEVRKIVKATEGIIEYLKVGCSNSVTPPVYK